MSKIGQCVSFCVRLILLNIMFSRFIPVVADVRISFLFKAEKYFIGWMDHNSFIHHLSGDTWVASPFRLL